MENPSNKHDTRRTNLAAALRDITRRLGRAPVATDFATDHPIHAFALPYWGGVAAWSAGSPERAQHKKGYWACRKNQVSALRRAVSQHPGVPVTHQLLRAAGLHRVAVVLDAAQLALLADEAGVQARTALSASRLVDARARHRRPMWRTAVRRARRCLRTR